MLPLSFGGVKDAVVVLIKKKAGFKTKYTVKVLEDISSQRDRFSVCVCVCVMNACDECLLLVFFVLTTSIRDNSFSNLHTYSH